MTILDIPGNYDVLTLNWLNAVLCHAHPGAIVTDFRLGMPDDGSSNRRKIHLQYNVEGKAAGLPDTVFCKAAANAQTRTVLAQFGSSEAEVKFYRNVQLKLDIPTPQCFFSGYNSETYAYFLVLEDLGDKVKFPDQTYSLSRPEAFAMVDSLARLHSRFYEDPALGGASLPFLRWHDWWNRLNAAAPGFALCCDEAFQACDFLMPSRLYRRHAEVWGRTIDAAQAHRTLPQTLLHSDVHLKNWFIDQTGRFGLHDWQLTTIGHWSRDLVYALVTSLDVEQRRQWFDDLLRYYLERMAELSAERVSFEDAHKFCRQQMMCVLSFWTITFNPSPEMPEMQPQETINTFLKRMFHAIDDFGSLDSFT